MDLLTGSSKLSWQPTITVDTTKPVYWISWRVSLCAIWIASSMVLASYLIWRYEGPSNTKPDRGETEKETVGTLYEDETWKPCLKNVNPTWLLAFRVVAFFVLLVLLIVNGVAHEVVHGGVKYYFYTEWTVTLVTIYFGLGSILSIYGCYQYSNRVGGDRFGLDVEHGNYVAPTNGEIAGIWGYIFQVIYQMSAGAVIFTDSVFWFIIVPFLAVKDCNLTFLTGCMHSVNAIFLLGDTALNSLRFPWFRFAYFVLWTAIYVLFQWVLHACVSVWWAYPFLDLSSTYAPVWYFAGGLMHIPCYSLFVLVIRMKGFFWARWFPESYCLMR